MAENLLYNENSALKRILDQKLNEGLKEGASAYVDEVEEITPDAFYENYVRKQKPLVLRGAANAWPATQRWDFDFFAQQYPALEVVTNLYDVQHKRKVNFRELAALLKTKQATPHYLQEWWFQENCAELLNDITVPEYFQDDCNKSLLGFYNNTLWIGQAGAFTPIHQDTTYANVWSAQIMGAKEWILIDKEAEILGRADGQPDFDRFFASADRWVYKTVLFPGDILYMPHKWWHRAETLTDAISLNTFYITSDIVQNYIKDVLRIPFAALLNKELMQSCDPMRYNICMQRSQILTKMLGFDPGNILNLDTSGQAKAGIYVREAS